MDMFYFIVYESKKNKEFLFGFVLGMLTGVLV